MSLGRETCRCHPFKTAIQSKSYRRIPTIPRRPTIVHNSIVPKSTLFSPFVTFVHGRTMYAFDFAIELLLTSPIAAADPSDHCDRNAEQCDRRRFGN
jgi:hypothetical protein